MVPTSLRATNAQTALAIALFNLPLHVEKGDSQVKIRPTLFSWQRNQNVNISTQTFFQLYKHLQ